MDPETANPILTSRVRGEETDMQGIVFYGNYLTYMDMAHNELLRRVGGLPAGVSEHVVHTELDYAGQATAGDEVYHYTRFTDIGDASMTAEYVATLANGSPLVDGTGVYVGVDEDGSTVRLPDDWRRRVSTFQTDPPAGV